MDKTCHLLHPQFLLQLTSVISGCPRLRSMNRQLASDSIRRRGGAAGCASAAGCVLLPPQQVVLPAVDDVLSAADGLAAAACETYH